MLAYFAAKEAEGDIPTLRQAAIETGLSIMMVRHILMKADWWTPERCSAAKQAGVTRSRLNPGHKGLRSARECRERKLAILGGPSGISAASSVLSKRECQVVTQHLMEGLTLESVASSLSVTRERIRQIENRAIQKMLQSQRRRPLGMVG